MKHLIKVAYYEVVLGYSLAVDRPEAAEKERRGRGFVFKLMSLRMTQARNTVIT